MLGGIDEAGRGPVIGPMVVALVVVSDDEKLIKMGVRDSKELSPRRRAELARMIMRAVDFYSYEVVEPRVIDEYVSRGLLNRLEAEVMARLISKALGMLSNGVVYVDSPDPLPDRFSELITRLLGSGNVRVVALNNADKLIPTVSAASILAKVKRDELIAELHRVYGDFGSGYPSDPRTMEFLRDWLRRYGELPPIVRRSWKTLSRFGHGLDDFL
ncbi:ribonuclease HII [Vulcanisaeta thermophila]|uniref:ribonuclease HII n=1 Tax=Vulcanisaeta thermophila TaxID=867917 RepID=UPI0008532832|nr:ribonuclease HII [Vulcanisaeta thermophila]